MEQMNLCHSSIQNTGQRSLDNCSEQPTKNTERPLQRLPACSRSQWRVPSLQFNHDLSIGNKPTPDVAQCHRSVGFKILLGNRIEQMDIQDEDGQKNQPGLHLCLRRVRLRRVFRALRRYVLRPPIFGTTLKNFVTSGSFTG